MKYEYNIDGEFRPVSYMISFNCEEETESN